MSNGKAVHGKYCPKCEKTYPALSKHLCSKQLDTEEERLYVREAGKIVDTKDYHFVIREDDIAKLNEKLDVIINMLSDAK